MNTDRESHLAPADQRIASEPRVAITLEAFRKLTAFIGLMRSEINGFGAVERSGNAFLVTDVFLVNQTVSGVSAETDPEALNHLVYAMVQRGLSPALLRFQWHSHADMEAFFSGTDIDTIRNYMNDFMISLVMNRRGGYACRIDIYKPMVLTLEVPLHVIVGPDEKILQQCRKDIGSHVKKSFWSSPFGTRRPRLETGDILGAPIPAENLDVENEAL